MTIRHVIYTQVPGIDGDGITAIEKNQLVQDVADVTNAVANVAAPNTGTAGDQLRIGTTEMIGPRWRDPDSVSPLDFDAAGDAVTDDYAAIMQAIDRLGPRGGRVDLAGKKYRSNTPITIDKPVTIQGGAQSRISGGQASSSGFKFGPNMHGLILTSVQGIHLLDFAIEADNTVTTTSGYPISNATVGDGVRVLASSAVLENLNVSRFHKGFAVRSGSGVGNIASHGVMIGCAANFNNQDGFFFGGHGDSNGGSDSNVWTVINGNASFNGRFGFYNRALYQNTFITPHTLRNLVADYYESAWGSHWINVYAEVDQSPTPNEGGKFVISQNARGPVITAGTDANAVASIGSGNNGGEPSFHFAAGGSTTTFSNINTPSGRDGISATGANIVVSGVSLTPIRMRTPVGGKVFEWIYDNPVAGALALRNRTDGNILLLLGGGTGNGSFTVGKAGSTLGFFGKAAVSQRPANPNTSGATLAALETEVNELKQLLRDYGLLAT